MDNDETTAEAIRRAVGSAGWLDEDSDTQMVFLLDALEPLLRDIRAQVRRIDAGDLRAIRTWLESF